MKGVDVRVEMERGRGLVFDGGEEERRRGGGATWSVLLVFRGIGECWRLVGLLGEGRGKGMGNCSATGIMGEIWRRGMGLFLTWVADGLLGGLALGCSYSGPTADVG